MLVVIAIAGFAYAEPNTPLFVVGMAVTGLSWWLVEAKGGKGLPRIIINFGVLAASAGLFTSWSSRLRAGTSGRPIFCWRWGISWGAFCCANFRAKEPPRLLADSHAHAVDHGGRRHRGHGVAPVRFLLALYLGLGFMRSCCFTSAAKPNAPFPRNSQRWKTPFPATARAISARISAWSPDGRPLGWWSSRQPCHAHSPLLRPGFSGAVDRHVEHRFHRAVHMQDYVNLHSVRSGGDGSQVGTGRHQHRLGNLCALFPRHGSRYLRPERAAMGAATSRQVALVIGAGHVARIAGSSAQRDKPVNWCRRINTAPWE